MCRKQEGFNDSLISLKTRTFLLLYELILVVISSLHYHSPPKAKAISKAVACFLIHSSQIRPPSRPISLELPLAPAASRQWVSVCLETSCCPSPRGHFRGREAMFINYWIALVLLFHQYFPRGEIFGGKGVGIVVVTAPQAPSISTVI